jgi:hypothetical protein
MRVRSFLSVGYADMCVSFLNKVSEVQCVVVLHNMNEYWIVKIVKRSSHKVLSQYFPEVLNTIRARTSKIQLFSRWRNPEFSGLTACSQEPDPSELVQCTRSSTIYILILSFHLLPRSEVDNFSRISNEIFKQICRLIKLTIFPLIASLLFLIAPS